MNKEQIKKVLEQLKEIKKRKFSQSYDLIINLKNLDPKQNPLDFFVTLPHPKSKKPKIAAFVGQELNEQSKNFCDLTISESDFPKYQDRKAQKKLAQDYDYFIAQANLMPKIAQIFGKTLGAKGKMPNPKLGCVVPPNASFEPLVKKLQHTIKLTAKKGANLQCYIGKEDQPEEQIIENVLATYQATLRQLPQEKHNIKNLQLKLTMGKPITI